MNDHGLVRDIPEGVKRDVRQACCNGCVICGKLPYTYEHFDPPFENATSHDPTGMALLCANHQLDRSAGRLSVDAVRLARANPFNKGEGAVWNPHFTEEKMTLNLFGNVIEGPCVGFAINNQVVFGMKAPETKGGAWLLTGSFSDSSGTETLRFADNEVIANTGVWDLTFEGKYLTVKSGPRSVVAKVGFFPEQNRIELSHLDMRLANGHFLKGTPKGISINGPQLDLVINGISGSYASGNAFNYGPAVTGQFTTIAVNDPRLGTFNDWKASS